MESATIFVREMKKHLHLVSIPQSLLKGHIQDTDVQSLDRKYVVQVLKLRSDFYRSDEVRELCRAVEANSVLFVCYECIIKVAVFCWIPFGMIMYCSCEKDWQ